MRAAVLAIPETPNVIKEKLSEIAKEIGYVSSAGMPNEVYNETEICHVLEQVRYHRQSQGPLTAVIIIEVR